tara:strand:+ start:3533 stop:3751 length:219 start_codon:yes stop_codon:yes gene_type:complete
MCGKIRKLCEWASKYLIHILLFLSIILLLIIFWHFFIGDVKIEPDILEITDPFILMTAIATSYGLYSSESVD